MHEPPSERFRKKMPIRIRYWFLQTAAITTIYLFSPVRNPYGDMALTIPTSRSILFYQNLDLNEYTGSPLLNHYGVLQEGTSLLNFFPWTPSLFALPTILINDLLSKVGVTTGSYRLIMWGNTWDLEAITASVLMGITSALIAELCWQRLRNTYPRRRIQISLAVGTVFGLGTSMWSIASRSIWQHGPSIFVVTLVLLILDKELNRSERQISSLASIGALVAFAYTIRPTNGILILVLSFYMLRFPRRLFGAYFAGLSSVMIGWTVINLLSGYGFLPLYNRSGRLEFHPDFFEAVTANLLSPSRGLLVFSPFLIFSILQFRVLRSPSRSDSLDVIAATMIILLLIGNSLFPHWWAGHSFGPRFMSETIPYFAILFIAGFRAKNCEWSTKDSVFMRSRIGLIAALSVVSVAIHAQGALIEETACWNRLPVDVDKDPSRVWSLRDAQVTSGIRSLITSTPRTENPGECFVNL